MKKFIIAAALVLGFAAVASAQPRAVGIRACTGAEISYQHTLGANFVEADLGLGSFVPLSLSLTAVYNWNLAQFGDAFNVYAGPGASVGLGLGEISYLSVGIAGQVGIEYDFNKTFNVPIQLSLDIRPKIGIVISNGIHFDDSWGTWAPHLGVRYSF